MTTWASLIQLITLLLTIAVLTVLLLSLYKIRKIHLISSKTLSAASEARRHASTIFPQLQALSELDKTLHLSWPLPPVRGWAGSPDFLLTVAEIILTRKPTTVVECSSGVSTLVAARCLQINGRGHVYSLEHETEHARKTNRMLRKYDVQDWATVLYSPLTSHEGESPWYDESVLPQDLRPIEVLVVDAPPHDTAPLARLPAFPRLLPRMSDDAVVILDDAMRPAETEIVRRWTEMAPNLDVTHLNHEKGCVILERGRD